MSDLWVARLGVKGRATRTIIFKVFNGELPIVAAQNLASGANENLIQVMSADDFIGNDFYELECL